MALISSSIPNFVNGVSQQPFTLRLASQGEVQENGLSTVSQGLKKRPPTKHLKRIQTTPLGDAYIHTINRDTSERYVAVATNGDLKVYDINGNEQTVNFPDGKSYLSTSTPSTSFSAVTVADYTFFVNKTKVVDASTVKTPKRPYEALVNVKQGNYGRTYKILVNEVVVGSLTTPNGTDASQAPQISTDYIAEVLYNNIIGRNAQVPVTVTNPAKTLDDEFATFSFNLPAGKNETNTFVKINDVPVAFSLNSSTGKFEIRMTRYEAAPFESAFTITATETSAGVDGLTATRIGSVIYLSSATDFKIRVEDGFNGGGMVAIKGELQKFADLPANAGVQGFLVKITGTGSGETQSSPFDSYYVRYNTEYGTGGVGTWQECPAPDISVGFTNINMPHILVREANGTFTFKKASWKIRVCGDLDSNPQPSFVGRTINDIFFYRNRLGFLADEAAVFSEAGEYFNFLRTTVTDLLDSDPIDVNASHTKVSLLKHAVPFNKQLLLVSDQTQFVVEAQDLLTPKTISIKVATEFPTSTKAEPNAIGQNVYFAVEKGNWTGFREYYADVNNLNYDSQDITGHLPQYIPANVIKISSSPNEDIMVALSASDRSSLYVYKFFWNNKEKLQSSWSKWSFGADTSILNVDFIESEMYLVVNRLDGVYFEKVSIALGNTETGEPYPVHLDRKVQIEPGNLIYDNGYTLIQTSTLGYTPVTGSYQVVVKSHPSLKTGEIFDVIIDGSTVKIKGNLTGAALTFGRKYNFKYQLSTITVKQQAAGGGQKSDTEGRLQLRKLALNYADSGYFTIKVTPEGRSTYTYPYSGKVLGNLSSKVGSYSIDSGRFSVPVISRNIGTDIVIENDSALPSSFLSADWEGFYVKRSQSV